MIDDITDLDKGGWVANNETSLLGNKRIFPFA